MEWWRENDRVYVIDSDVIFHGHESTWKNPGENIDLVFFERWWNGEVTAGKKSKVVTNLESTKPCLCSKCQVSRHPDRCLKWCCAVFKLRANRYMALGFK